MTYEGIKERYLKNYIRDDQLERFKTLGVITAEQYEQYIGEPYPVETETAAGTNAE